MRRTRSLVAARDVAVATAPGCKMPENLKCEGIPEILESRGSVAKSPGQTAMGHENLKGEPTPGKESYNPGGEVVAF